MRAVGALRAADNPDKEGHSPYYVGLVQPKDTFETYCGNLGCVVGLAPLNTSDRASFRYSIAIGYPSERSRLAGIHELGHSAGRRHAPSDRVTGSYDSNYPVAQADLDFDGYDERTKTTLSLSTHHDVMGYVRNKWTSNYGAHLFHQRMQDVRDYAAGLSSARRSASFFEQVVVSPGGEQSDAFVVRDQPVSGQHNVKVGDSAGKTITTVMANKLAVPDSEDSIWEIPFVAGACFATLPDGQKIKLSCGT